MACVKYNYILQFVYVFIRRTTFHKVSIKIEWHHFTATFKCFVKGSLNNSLHIDNNGSTSSEPDFIY